MKFLVNPSKFNEIADYIFKPILVLSIILLSLGLLFSFYLSPDDYQQGSTVRIMYVHVPSAWLAAPKKKKKKAAKKKKKRR